MLSEDLAQAERLSSGAAQTLARAAAEETTGRFLALLDIASLVAAAAGRDADERQGILRLFEQLTDSVLDRETLEHHFGDLDEAVASSSHGERLGEAAGDLRDEDRSNAITFAAAIAMSDGWLGDAELGVLIELGRHLALPADKARAQVEQVIQRVENRLR
jgi:hypothetical protein